MKKSILALVLIFNVTLLSAQTVIAQSRRNNIPVQARLIEAKEIDPRTMALRAYLEKRNSPLKDNAHDFIEAADMYGVDWKLVPAIAGVESGFGKHTPGNAYKPSYNGWGWGVYGNQALYFPSWKDAIHTVTRGLKTGYIDKGLTTPAAMNRKYASSPTWGSKVTYFLNDLEKHAQTYKPLPEVEEIQPDRSTNVAAASAKLNSRTVIAFAK